MKAVIESNDTKKTIDYDGTESSLWRQVGKIQAVQLFLKAAVGDGRHDQRPGLVVKGVQELHDAALVRLVGTAYIHDGPLEIPAHVGDGADIAVGNDDDVSVEVPDGRGADSDCLHCTILIVDTDNITDRNGMFTPDKQTG